MRNKEGIEGRKRQIYNYSSGTRMSNRKTTNLFKRISSPEVDKQDLIQGG
jgi:hypothetical protein